MAVLVMGSLKNAPKITKDDKEWKDDRKDHAVDSRSSLGSLAPSTIGSEDTRSDLTARVGFESPLAVFFNSAAIRRWDPARFQTVKTLQEAPRNQGRVNCVLDTSSGRHVAVKSMPNRWVCERHELFVRTYPYESEQPWMDIGCTAFLTSIEYPYVCPLLGVFRDKNMTHFMTEFAARGDLLGWATKGAGVIGHSHELAVVTIARQLVDAVRLLHDLSIVHRDISLENILLAQRPGGGGIQIQLIDFGMATTQRFMMGDGRGKPAYQAPETESGELCCDGFLCDAFSVGVVLYSLMLQQMPWLSTQQGKCKVYASFQRHGFDVFARKRRCFGQDFTVAQYMSPTGIRVLGGLLAISPEDRFTLGESADFNGVGRSSVWEEDWLLCLP